MSTLVAFFSATGRTAAVAGRLAHELGAELYEIRPEVKYTKPDLNWLNLRSRSSVEMNNRSRRPAIVTGDLDLSGYDTVCLGFPIWWYTAPTLINTFLESYDFSHKKLILFATSGSSGLGGTVKELIPSAPDAEIVEGAVVSGVINEAKLKALVEACQ